MQISVLDFFEMSFFVLTLKLFVFSFLSFVLQRMEKSAIKTTE